MIYWCYEAIKPQKSSSAKFSLPALRRGNAFESGHLLLVYDRAGKAGINKNLALKIQNVCGIFITESESLSKLICRKCGGPKRVNLDKEVKFANAATHVEQKYSVKGCVGHCVVFLGKTLYSHSPSLHPGV